MVIGNQPRTSCVQECCKSMEHYATLAGPEVCRRLSKTSQEILHSRLMQKRSDEVLPRVFGKADKYALVAFQIVWI